MTSFAILISGKGSNMEAIAEAVASKKLNGRIAFVASDNPGATGLKRAADLGLPTAVLPYAEGKKKGEEELRKLCALHGVEWIVLAGFLSILSPEFVRSFKNRIVNIHPSLLPSFPGKHGIVDAWRRGVKITGVTVHLVDEGVDTGPILAQQALKICPGESIESLEERIHRAEHSLYRKTLALLFSKETITERC
ncbi:MAG: phosphoribosylglycinamide formyltransferase [Synergistaceae bacterium]|nr:phosphoribosylglycinamide formyltransferase [Synergistaceae bacterium]